MMSRPSVILDQYGNRFQKPNGKPRPELAHWLERRRPARQVEGKYDAAQTTDDNKNYWAAADSYDADSANSLGVRQTLVKRSRYEIQSSGYADGIASTWTTDLIGKGPSLRMQTGSEGFNRMIETTWFYWTKAIQFRRKLWTLAHALHSDGEGIGVVRKNGGLNHPVKLDLRLYETEQCQTPMLPFESGYIDGIKFDSLGNVVHYDILQQHPGATGYFAPTLVPEHVPAKYVLHWFKMRRPGQHRGVPACTSTLNLGASIRRFMEAVLASAETAADFTLFLKTLFQPDELEAIEPMSTLAIQKRMMTALPNSVEPFQLKAEQPTSTFEAFTKELLNAMGRPVSMPLNKIMCNSASYNYASGRLDHQTYYAALDVDREDCNDLVMDPLFNVWFDSAVVTFGWLGGNPDAIGPAARAHQWDWPKHRVADIDTEAAANDRQLKNGSKSLDQVATEAGNDYEDDLLKQAASNGVSVDQQRQINLLLNLPQHVIPIVAELLGIAPKPKPVAIPAATSGVADDEQDETDEEQADEEDETDGQA